MPTTPIGSSSILWQRQQQQRGLPHNLKNVYATLPLPSLTVAIVAVVTAAVWLPAHELAIIKNAITANFI